MKYETKQRIIRWIWEKGCKLLNYHERIQPIETHTEKIQLAQFCHMIPKQEIEYWNEDYSRHVLTSVMAKSLMNMIYDKEETNPKIQNMMALKIEEEIMPNGDKLIRAQLRYLPWKEQQK